MATSVATVMPLHRAAPGEAQEIFLKIFFAKSVSGLALET
jgi:hypothetical protein